MGTILRFTKRDFVWFLLLIFFAGVLSFLTVHIAHSRGSDIMVRDGKIYRSLDGRGGIPLWWDGFIYGQYAGSARDCIFYNYTGSGNYLMRLQGDGTNVFTVDKSGTLVLHGLTASRLLCTNASKVISSTLLSNWLGGTTNQVTVADDGDGTATLSLPQNIHTGATPTFTGLVLSGGNLALDNNKAIYFEDSSGTSRNVVYVDGSNKTHIGHDGLGDITINPGGVLANQIISKTTTGYVGIGTVSPDTALEISGDEVSTETTISSYHDTEATSPTLTLRKADGSESSPGTVDSSAILGTVNFGGYDDNGWDTGATIYGKADANWGASERGTDLYFQTRDGNDDLADQMVIVANGDVGIGTMLPARRLSVSEITAQTTLCVSAMDVGMESSGVPGIGFGSMIGFSAETSTPGTTDEIASIGAVWEDATAGNVDGALVFKTRKDSGVYVEAMRVHATGSVRVGDSTNNMTTAPTGGVGIAYNGTARPTRYIELPIEVFEPEGDGGSNSGTVTGNFDTTNFRTYWRWSSGSGSQDMDFWVEFLIPDDFSAWAASNSFNVDIRVSDKDNNVATVTMYEDDNSVDAGINGVSILPSANATWETKQDQPTETYVAGERAKLKIHVGNNAAGDTVDIGRVYFSYLAKN